MTDVVAFAYVSESYNDERVRSVWVVIGHNRALCVWNVVQRHIGAVHGREIFPEKGDGAVIVSRSKSRTGRG